MPRTLPWLVDAAAKKVAAAPPAPSSPNRKRASSPDDLVNSDLDVVGAISTPKRKGKGRSARTPSTSPPPAPPDVEYMREGYSADDVWMMVEDEFLSTAMIFTKHIHHAEYVRLKKRARSRGEGTLREIGRGTDGTTEQSKGLKMRLEMDDNGRKIKNGLKKIDGREESDEDEDAYMQDPQLAGLMTGSQRSGKVLTGVARAKANTRAAAGFKQSPHKAEKFAALERDLPQKAYSKPASKAPAEAVPTGDTDDEDEDDLDSAPSKSSKAYAHPASSHHPPGTSQPRHKSITMSDRQADSPGIFKRFAQPAPEEVQVSKPVKVNNGHRPERTDRAPSGVQSTSPPKSTISSRSAESQAAADFMARRRAMRAKKEQDEKRKAQCADDVPTFII